MKDVLSPALFELAKLSGGKRKPITLKDDSALAFLVQSNEELMEKHKVKIVWESSSKPSASSSRVRAPTPKRLPKKQARPGSKSQSSRGRSNSASRGGSRRSSKSSAHSRSRAATPRRVRFADDKDGKGKGKKKGKASKKKITHRSRGHGFWNDAAKTSIDFYKFCVVQTFRSGFRVFAAET